MRKTVINLKEKPLCAYCVDEATRVVIMDSFFVWRKDYVCEYHYDDIWKFGFFPKPERFRK